MTEYKGYTCNREGCQARSNGNTSAWWAIKVCLYGEYGLQITLLPARSGDEKSQHYCGMEHAVSAIQDAMRAMQATP